MDLVGPCIIRNGSPYRIVHLSKSLEHLKFLHLYRPSSHLLALPPHFRWIDVRHCQDLDMNRLCSAMGWANLLWSLEILKYTPIKRVLIEDRLIEYTGRLPTLEVVELH